MRARRVAVGEVRAPDSDASGAFTAKIYRRLYAERLVAPKRRKVPGAFTPKTVWFLNGESSHKDWRIPRLKPKTSSLTTTSAELMSYPNGRFARRCGLVTGRQRPGTAKGVMCVTPETRPAM
jgi:hypothetical protein